MSKRVQETILPFSWDGWDQNEISDLQFYKVEFTDDFGVFSKGESHCAISVDYSKGEVTAYDYNGLIIKTQSFVAKPI